MNIDSDVCAEHEQRDNDAFAPLFFENPLPMWIYDRHSLRFLDANRAATRRFGYTRTEFRKLKLTDLCPRLPLTGTSTKPAGTPARHAVEHDCLHVAKDGSRIHADVSQQDIVFRQRDAVLAVLQDVTRIHDMERQLRQQAAYAEQLFHNSPDAIVLLDCDDRIVSINQSFCELFRLSPEEALGNYLSNLIVPPDRLEEARTLSAQVISERIVFEETTRLRGDGSNVIVSIVGYPVLVDGEVTGIYAVYRDVTERRKIVDELEFHARHDPLTGLVNRRQFADVCRQLIGEAREGHKHVFLYIDLDKFKLINDTCGHSAGDQLLSEVADALKRTVRETDLIGRLGGDEFAIVLRDCSLARAEEAAATIIEELRLLQFTWHGRTYRIGASIGIAAIDEFVPNLTALMNRADTACYYAKERGRNRYQVYREDNHELQRSEGETSWAVKLQEALEQDRFELFAQSIQPLAAPIEPHERLELLLRYRGDDELVHAHVFIPAAERYHLMDRIDRWVVSKALDVLAAADNDGPLISINLSPSSFTDRDFIGFLKEELARTGVAGQSICFEIAESAAVSNLEQAKHFVGSIHELGAVVALDHFGNGVSSFSALKSLPVDFIKIDGAFMQQLSASSIDHSIIEAIKHLAHLLKIRTIAKSVESKSALEELRSIGIDFAQGRALAAPASWHNQEMNNVK